MRRLRKRKFQEKNFKKTKQWRSRYAQKFIGCFDDDSEWTVAKRFSDFDELREFLEEKGVEIGGAAFPSKTLLSSVSESTVNERKGQLQAWLYALLECHADSKAVQMFLREDGTGRALDL